MKKKFEMLNAQIAAKNSVIANLKKRVAKNTISEETRAEVEALIQEKEAELATIKQMLADAEADESDKSEELKTKIAEMQRQIREIEDSLKQPKGMLKVANFVESKEGRKAFMNCVRNSATAQEFRENWKGVLAQNGITPANLMMPPAMVTEINDAWEKSANGFMELLDVTGLKVIKVALDTTAPDSEPARAKGHTRGKQKEEQDLTLTPKEIRPQIIYKYITIDRETELEDENGVLARFIARELVDRTIHEIMRAVLIGDGRLPADPNKISKFEAVARAVSDNYVTVTTAGAPVITISEAAAAVDSIDAPGDIVLAASKQTIRSLREYIGGTGGTVRYNTLEELAEQLGVSRIVETRLLNTSTPGEPQLVAFVGKAYKVVGDITSQGFEDFNLEYNKKEYLTEVYAGGALALPASGACILHA